MYLNVPAWRCCNYESWHLLGPVVNTWLAPLSRPKVALPNSASFFLHTWMTHLYHSFTYPSTSSSSTTLLTSNTCVCSPDATNPTIQVGALCFVPQRPDTPETKLTTSILLTIFRKQPHHLIFKNFSLQSIRALYQQWPAVTRHTIRISQQAPEHQEESIQGRMVGIREQLRCKR